MKTPAWRSKLHSDAQNVTYVTRLTAILFQRTLLHCWLSLKAVWRFGLLRSVLLLPLLIVRALFFPLQWPVSIIGGALASLCRWFLDGPLMSIGRGLCAMVTAPLRLIADASQTSWQWVCSVGVRCRQQYWELRQLGFLNAMALMPFLIVRLVQGAVLTLLAVVWAVSRWCWKGSQAGGSYALAALLWIAGSVSMTGSLRRVKHGGAVVLAGAASSTLAGGSRSLYSATVQFGRSLSGVRIANWVNWSALSRSFREQTAWMLVTVAGTLGLLLMLYLQWTSAATNSDRLHNSVVAMNSPRSADRFDERVSSPVDNTPQSPPVANGFQELDADPFLPTEDSRGRDSARSPVAEPAADPFADPFAPQSPSSTVDPLPAESALAEERDEPVFNPFANAPQPGLEMTLGWLDPRVSFDELPGNRFVVSGPSSPVAPLESLPALGRADDGWQVVAATVSPPSSQSAAARMRLVVPDLIVPAKVNERPIDANDVTPGWKELNVTVSRDIPAMTAVDRLTSYRILVRNRGRKTIERVTVEELLPNGHRVIETSPAALQQSGKLVWQLGALQPGEERSLRVQVMPTVVGPVENIVTVRPVAAVVTKTYVSKPTLQLDVSAPFRVALGERCVVQFKVTNTSAQQFDGVILRTALPDGLSHNKGSSLDYRIKSLSPGETHYAQLTMRAETVGSRQLAVGLVWVGGDGGGGGTMQTLHVVVDVVEPSAMSHSVRTAYHLPCLGRPQ